MPEISPKPFAVGKQKEEEFEQKIRIVEQQVIEIATQNFGWPSRHLQKKGSI